MPEAVRGDSEHYRGAPRHGGTCFILNVLAPSPEDLETIVDRIAAFGAVTTSVVLRSEPPRTIGAALIAHKAD